MSPEAKARAEGVASRVLGGLLRKLVLLAVQELLKQLPALLGEVLDLIDDPNGGQASQPPPPAPPPGAPAG